MSVSSREGRRASSQSQGESSSTSDVDSPAPAAAHHHTVPIDSNSSPAKESTSPLLTSILQSPSNIMSMASGDTPRSSLRTSDSQPSLIVVVDSPQKTHGNAAAGDAYSGHGTIRSIAGKLLTWV